jgi:hypothetical protein
MPGTGYRPGQNGLQSLKQRAVRENAPAVDHSDVGFPTDDEWPIKPVPT